MDLKMLGWAFPFEEAFTPYRHDGFSVGGSPPPTPASIVSTRRGASCRERSRASCATRRADPQDFPAVGDWVALRARAGEGRAAIHAVLPRKSRFSRKVAGAVTAEQVV